MKAITVIDSIMGSGKTSWAIQHMSETDEDKRFIYITPFLDEVQRIKDSVTNRIFVEPQHIKGETKLESLKQLLAQGRDIVSTHALFKKIDEEVIELLRDSGYTLILDEVLNVVESVQNISSKDIQILEEEAKLIEIKDDGKVVWVGGSELTRYNDIRESANSNNLYAFRKKTFLLWIFPSEIFQLFDEVYVLTYLFDGQIQRYYYEYFKLPYEFKAIAKVDGRYELVNYDFTNENRKDWYDLISIYDGKMNDIGKRKNALSATWLRKQEDAVLKQLGNNAYNFFRHNCKLPSEEVYYSTLKDVSKKVKPNGYTKRFVPFNIRATNDFVDCKAVAFLLNRYSTPYEVVFFQENGVQVNEELLAVSDLLQWLWRSQLRVGKPIQAYIPSKRMRELLEAWATYKL